MKLQTLSTVVILMVLVVTLSCGRLYHKYTPETESPRMIYAGDEVQSLVTIPSRITGEDVFVEVTTREARTETGKLISITESEIVVSPHYHYASKGDSTVRVETERVIPKDEILILKVF